MKEQLEMTEREAVRKPYGEAPVFNGPFVD